LVYISFLLLKEFDKLFDFLYQTSFPSMVLNTIKNLLIFQGFLIVVEIDHGLVHFCIFLIILHEHFCSWLKLSDY